MLATSPLSLCISPFCVACIYQDGGGGGEGGGWVAKSKDSKKHGLLSYSCFTLILCSHFAGFRSPDPGRRRSSNAAHSNKCAREELSARAGERQGRMRAGHRKQQEEEKEWSPAPESTSNQDQNQVKDDIRTHPLLFVFFVFYILFILHSRRLEQRMKRNWIQPKGTAIECFHGYY